MPTPDPDSLEQWFPAVSKALEHRHAGSLMAGAASFAAIMLLGQWVLTPVPWYVAASAAASVAILVALVNDRTPDA
jgi:hypothetical protein